MNRFIKALSLAAAGLGGFALPASAVIIKVIDPNGGTDYTAMKVVMEEVKNRLQDKASIPSTLNGYEIRIMEGNQMTAELSLVPGTTSLFWSDQGVVYQNGFSFKGGRALFSSSEKSAVERGQKPVLQAAVLQDRLSMVTLSDSRLSLRYSVAAPGPVKVELFSAKGSLVKRWNWSESTPGMQLKTLDVPRLDNGRHFLRWSNGGYRVVRQLAPSQGGTTH